jgi:hypothetical protein
MPLWKAHKKTKANLRRVVSHNVRVERNAGKPMKQAVAIAMRAAGVPKRKRKQ